MNLGEVRLWLRIDYNLKNDLIGGLIQSAKPELLLSGTPDYDKGDLEYPLFCTMIKYIVARDYENRGYSNGQFRSKVFNERGLQKIALKLRKW